MCSTHDCALLKTHSLQAVVILSASGKAQSIVVAMHWWLTYLVFTLQCLLKASRWGNRVAYNPWEQKDKIHLVLEIVW